MHIINLAKTTCQSWGKIRAANPTDLSNVIQYTNQNQFRQNLITLAKLPKVSFRDLFQFLPDSKFIFFLEPAN